MWFTTKGFRANPRRIAIFFLCASEITGIVFLGLYLARSSAPGNQLILGLSASRLFIGFIFALLLLINLGIILLFVFERRTRQNSSGEFFFELYFAHQTLVIVALYASLIFTGTFLLLTIPPVIRPLAFLEPVSVRLGSFIAWIFLSSLLLIIMLRLIDTEMPYIHRIVARLDGILTIVGLLLLTFVVYARIAIMIDWVNKTSYPYWNLLAEQFLNGKLYLENPPTTHDLTFHNGRWYVPMPPLPAIFMMPLAYLIDGRNIKTGYLSMMLGSVNGLLVFLVLEQLKKLKWINLSKIGIFLLISIFLFGTPFLWVTIDGGAWFVSQILTALFLTFSIYAALRAWSPWVVGILIAIAITARPNSLMTWPFVFAISMQIIKETRGSIDLKQAFLWSIKTLLPIGAAVIGLFIYNYLRFDHFLDFGYTTINGDPLIVNNAQTYGLFSPHFILSNLKVMFFNSPRIHLGSRWPIEPSPVGMSLFLTTPSLFYLFHRYPKQWWIIGAWMAILFNMVLLSFYHNTGSQQFGYRYIIDMLTPLITMLAVGLNNKIPWHFILITFISITINIYGAYWVMNS